jgi:hypothetical protein
MTVSGKNNLVIGNLISPQAGTESLLSRVGRPGLAPETVLTPTQARIDGLVGSTLQVATDWRTVAGVFVGGTLLNRLGAMAATARLGASAETVALSSSRMISWTPRTVSLLSGASLFALGSAGCSSDDSTVGHTPDARSVDPVGSEYPLTANSSTGTNQGLSLAINGSGNLVAAWADVVAGSTTGTGVFARPFDSLGSPGDVTTVDSPSSSVDVNPSVSTNSRGNFVVSWTNATGPADSPSSVLARRFDNTGRSVGATLTAVAPAVQNPLPLSSVVLFEDGGFAVISGATGHLFNADNSSADNINLDLGGSTAGAVGVGTTTQGQWAWTAIVPGSGGSSEVRFQRFNGHSPVGAASSFPIGNLGTAASVRVATLPNHGSMVVWQTNGGMRGQIVDEEGRPFETPFSINSVSPGQSFSIASDERGSFVVAWEEGNQIKASVYNGTGDPLFQNIDVSGSGGENREVVAAANGTGRVTIGWRRFSTDGGAHYDLMARNYQIAY